MGSLKHISSRSVSSRGGFTAIEISAVATIIAILAMILIPIMRSRVEEARVTAAKEDMLGIDKAQSIAFAYTGKYFRTFDLSLSGTDAARLPQAFWDREVLPSDEPNLVANFRGPFTAPQATMTVQEAIDFFPHLFRGSTGGSGPILIVADDDTDESGTGALTRRRIPIDPWGSPYLFFGSGRMGTVGSPADTNGAETDFSTAVVYSLGQNGVAGDDIAGGSNPGNYFRRTQTGTGVLGLGDDHTREF